jgi:PAS domain S-box-containing protein
MVSRGVADLLAAIVLGVAIAAQLLFPTLPPFILLFPAVWLTAFVGGPIAGGVSLLVSLAFVLLRQTAFGDGKLDLWEGLGLLAFTAGAGLAIGIMHLYQQAVARLNRERMRLDAALRAANAAIWEINPQGRLFWDKNFYALVGLDPQNTPPSTEAFLAMVHPEDRERMAAARRAIDAGEAFSPFDEYRLTKPGGDTVWLENHRTLFEEAGRYVIGITQDVTRRKRAEQRVQLLLREASHRAKNQFAVIQAIARETLRSTGPSQFEEAFTKRVGALARSHDLLVNGNGNAVELRELVAAHLAPFGAEARAVITGAGLGILPNAAQYLGMAFHELSTNATKYGALSIPNGTIEIRWTVVADPAGDRIVIEWLEHGGPPVAAPPSRGFGTSVLSRLVPRALFGEATLTASVEGVHWKLTAPYDAVAEKDGSG